MVKKKMKKYFNKWIWKNQFINNIKDNLSFYLHINKNDIKIINIKRGSIKLTLLIENHIINITKKKNL